MATAFRYCQVLIRLTRKILPRHNHHSRQGNGRTGLFKKKKKKGVRVLGYMGEEIPSNKSG